MNGKKSKLLRKWATLKKMNYDMAKRLYLKANKYEREQITTEIQDFLTSYIPKS